MVRGEKELFRLFLLLLTDANLEVLVFRFLVGFVVMPRHSIRQIGIHVGILRQNRHDREILVASRAKWPEPLDIRDCHTGLV